MQSALQQHRPVNVVNGLSPLLNLPGFDFVWGFSQDYMHSLFPGVVRQITDQWLTSVNTPFYIGLPSVLSVVGARLLKIKPSHVFTQLPRLIQTKKFWKASEWKHWLLGYSVPCLVAVLPPQYLCLWVLLENAAYLVLQDKIT